MRNLVMTQERRAWIGLAVLALPTLLLSLDVSVLYLALPHLAADLGADSTQQLWILDIYSFVLAGFLVTMGTLGDRIGRPSSFRRSSSSMQARSSPFWTDPRALWTRSWFSGVGATRVSPTVPGTSSGLRPRSFIAARFALTKRDSVSS